MTTGSELDQTGADVRPIVAAGRRRLPTWLLVGGVMVGGLALFLALDGKRRAASAPAVTVRSAEALATIATPPPLYIPSYASAQTPSPPPPPPPLPPRHPLSFTASCARCDPGDYALRLCTDVSTATVPALSPKPAARST